MKGLLSLMRNQTAGEPLKSERCRACRSRHTGLVVPTSPEVLTYRCFECGDEWSVLAVDSPSFVVPLRPHSSLAHRRG